MAKTSTRANDPALDQAMLALRMQRPDEAERIASKVLRSDRGNLVATQILARALIAKDRAAEAVEVLQRAARRSGNPEIETLLGHALAAAGESDRAIEQLRTTCAKRPPYVAAFLELSGMFNKLGRYDEGVAVLDEVLPLAPDALDVRMGLGYLHVKRNDRIRAREFFSQVRDVEPSHIEAIGALAKVMALDGDYGRAADLYRHALGLQPDDVVNRTNFAKCLLELGQRDAAEAALRTAIKGAAPLAGRAVTALAASSHGRFFLRPSDAEKFLQVKKS